MQKKVTIVGAGHVGEVSAMRIAQEDIADVVMIDIIEDMPQGKALDMKESSPIEGFDAKIAGTNDYKDTEGSDVAVITAGSPRKPGMSRDELLEINAKVITEVTEKIVEYSPDCKIIMVTNPLDVMAYQSLKVSDFPKNRVMGMAGMLDTGRFRAFVSMELDVSVQNIQSIVLGGHGDSMVPLPRYTTVSGIPLTQLLDEKTIDRLVKRTRGAGGEIVELLGDGSAYYAPSSGVCKMVEAIIQDRKKIMPCAAYLEGEYGVEGTFFGVPAKLGKDGVEDILEIELTREEQKAAEKSASAVKDVIERLEDMDI